MMPQISCALSSNQEFNPSRGLGVKKVAVGALGSLPDSRLRSKPACGSLQAMVFDDDLHRDARELCQRKAVAGI
jgi:hypothetical protein